MNLDTGSLETLRQIATGGAPLLLLVAVIILWRQYVALQARYEHILERCIAALTKVAEHTHDDED
jgi:hypothetical protein